MPRVGHHGMPRQIEKRIEQVRTEREARTLSVHCDILHKTQNAHRDRRLCAALVEEGEERLERVVVLQEPLELRRLRRHVLPLELELVDEEVGDDAVEELQPAGLLLQLRLDRLLLLEDVGVPAKLGRAGA